MPSREVWDRWIVVLILWLSHAVYFMNYMTVGTLAPFIKPELNLSSAQIGLLCSAMTIGCMVSQIPAGILSDVFGARWAMLFGHLLIGGSAMLISFLHSYLSIFSCLVVLGIGIGCNQAPASKAIITWFPTKGTATAMGVKQTGINMGAILASLCLPAIALSSNSWRYSFRVAGWATLIPATLFLVLFRERPPHAPMPPRARVVQKKDLLQVLYHRDFQLMCLSGILFLIAQHSFSTHFLLYGSKALNLSIRESGGLMAICFGTGAFARIGWSLLSDYFLGGKRKIVVILIGVLGAVASFAFIPLKALNSTWLIYSFVVLFGLTGMGWTAIYFTMLAEFPRKELAGVVTGTAFVLWNIGVVIGPPLFGYFVDLTGKYALSWFLVGSCMAVVALLAKIQRIERMAS